jgi:hypothetical protein
MSKQEDIAAPNRPPDESKEEQLFPTDTCFFCYQGRHAYQILPCEHLIGCGDCIRSVVTKHFTEDPTSHKCIFCKREVDYFLHLESGGLITTAELQNQYPDEMEEENIRREIEYEQYIEEIVNSRETEEALGIYDNDDDEDFEDDDDNEEEHAGEDNLQLMRRMIFQDRTGRRRIVHLSNEQSQQMILFIRRHLENFQNNYVNRLRQTSTRIDRREEEKFVLETAAEEIEGDLDYVPSDDELEDAIVPHPMATRSQGQPQMEEMAADETTPLTRNGRRRRRRDDPAIQEEGRYNLRRRG